MLGHSRAELDRFLSSSDLHDASCISVLGLSSAVEKQTMLLFKMTW